MLPHISSVKHYALLHQTSRRQQWSLVGIVSSCSWSELRHYLLYQRFLGNMSTGCADLLRSVEWPPQRSCVNEHGGTEMVLPFPPCRPLHFDMHSLLNTGTVAQGHDCLPAIEPHVLQLHLIFPLTTHSTLGGSTGAVSKENLGFRVSKH